MSYFFDSQNKTAAEKNDSASCFMSAASVTIMKTLAAISIMMAVLLFCSLSLLDILISIILGVIVLVIVRGETKPVSRT